MSHSTKSASATSTRALRHRGLVAGRGGRNEVSEFTGMYPLKPGYVLEQITGTLAPGGLQVPPGGSFAPLVSRLGVRAARWFPGTSTRFGPTLYFTCQFDGPLERFLDDLVLVGGENLAQLWGQCVGCPQPPAATARDLVDYIAAGQVRTLAFYDAFPSLSHGEIQKAADWYEKTMRFRRAIAAVGGRLDDKLAAFIRDLALPGAHQPGQAVIDNDAEEDP